MVFVIKKWEFFECNITYNDMKANVELGLEGAFKVDIYKGKELVSSTDFFSNFITPTGLHYPTIYAFADCFRYLSIGQNSPDTPNRGATGAFPSGTTGLASPISTFTTSVGTQSGLWIGWQGYVTGNNGESSACGTTVTAEGVRLFRAWSIPTGGEDITMNEPGGGQELTIGEFMVSPTDQGNTTGKMAFSRVRRNLSIPNGHKAIITYQLLVRVANTGITSFGTGTFRTGNANLDNDRAMVTEWERLSGYYRQVYHGLRCIDPFGGTFIPKYGDAFEPSTRNIDRLSFYLSPDNSQFDVSTSGYAQTNEDNAYAADGLREIVRQLNFSDASVFSSTYTAAENLNTVFTNNNPSRLENVPDDDDQDSPRKFANIRLGADGGANFLQLPKLDNYSLHDNPITTFNYQTRQNVVNLPFSYATPGISGFKSNLENYGQRAIFSTRTTQVPFRYTGSNKITGRTKTVTRKSFFAPVSSLGYNTRFGSLVYAFRATDGGAGERTYYPLIDCLFYDTSGRSLMQHYRIISGVYLTERGRGIKECTINIRLSGDAAGTAAGENIKRYANIRTFQGPLINGAFDPNHPILAANAAFDYTYGSGESVSGTNPVLLNQSGGYDVSTNPTGWGFIYGIVSPFEDYQNYITYPKDCGLVDHSLIANTKPTSGTNLYWPYNSPNTRLILEITNVKFYCGTNGIGYSSGAYNAGCGGAIANSGFRFPTGYIVHSEFMNSIGGRLLPNYGRPNVSNTNTYTAATGGSLPALSMDNGIEMYLDVSWSSPCSDATDC